MQNSLSAYLGNYPHELHAIAIASPVKIAKFLYFIVGHKLTYQSRFGMPLRQYLCSWRMES